MTYNDKFHFDISNRTFVNIVYIQIMCTVVIGVSTDPYLTGCTTDLKT